ncbi:MAG: hypothetical protein OHK006_21310 [Thermodesulfovibrionales bacterium]
MKFKRARFLDWWKARLARYCMADVLHGLYTDQKWVDLTPALFEGVFLLREPGYNVAYWNLHEKEFSACDGEITVNGEPFFFYHFSALTVDDLDLISKHQTRYRLSRFPELQTLFAQYRDLLVQNGYPDCAAWPYTFDYYVNGERITESDRLSYRRLGSAVKRFGDPFAVDSGSFYQYRKPERIKEEEEQRALAAHEESCRLALQELAAIHQSDGWKALQAYYRVRNRMFPPGRLRTRAVQRLLRAMGTVAGSLIPRRRAGE